MSSKQGSISLKLHLDREVGARRPVLAECGGIGRTEQFTSARLNAPVEPGVMLDLAIAGQHS